MASPCLAAHVANIEARHPGTSGDIDVLAADAELWSQEEPPSVEKVPSDMLQLRRMADYLNPVPVRRKAPRVEAVGPFGALWEVIIVRFLSIPPIVGEEPDLQTRSIMYDENANIAVVAALLSLIFFSYWHEGFRPVLGEDNENVRLSYFGQLVGEEWIEDHIGPSSEVARLLILTGLVYGFTIAAVTATVTQLMLDQIPDESDALVFKGKLGGAAKIPFLFLQHLGIIGYVGFVFRALLIPRHGFTWIALLTLLVFLVVCHLSYLSRTIRCLYGAVNERSQFEDIELTPDQIHEDLDKYFAARGERASLNHCLWMMSARSPSGVHLPMAAQTTLRIKVAFYRRKMIPALQLHGVEDGWVLNTVAQSSRGHQQVVRRMPGIAAFRHPTTRK